MAPSTEVRCNLQGVRYSGGIVLYSSSAKYDCGGWQCVRGAPCTHVLSEIINEYPTFYSSMCIHNEQHTSGVCNIKIIIVFLAEHRKTDQNGF